MEIRNVSFAQNTSFKRIPSIRPQNITVEYTDKNGAPVKPKSIAEAMRYYTEYALADAKEKDDKVRVTFYDKNGKPVKPKSMDQGFDYILTPVHTHLLTPKKTEPEPNESLIPTTPTELDPEVVSEPNESLIPTTPTELDPEVVSEPADCEVPTELDPDYKSEPNESSLPTTPTELDPDYISEPNESTITTKTAEHTTVDLNNVNSELKVKKGKKGGKKESLRRLLAAALTFTQCWYFQKGVRVSIEDLLEKSPYFKKEPGITETYNADKIPSESAFEEIGFTEPTAPITPTVDFDNVIVDFIDKDGNSVEPTSPEQAMEFFTDGNEYGIRAYFHDKDGNNIEPTSIEQGLGYILKEYDSDPEAPVISEEEVEYDERNFYQEPTYDDSLHYEIPEPDTENIIDNQN